MTGWGAWRGSIPNEDQMKPFSVRPLTNASYHDLQGVISKHVIITPLLRKDLRASL